MFNLGAASVLSGAKAAAAVNPALGAASLGLQLLGGGGLFSSSKSSTVAGHATGYSGIGAFSVDSEINFPGKPLFDMENPVHILVAGGLIVAAIYAYKKIKG